MCLVLFELGPNQKLEETQACSLKCLRQSAQILLDSAVLAVRPADINKRRMQQVIIVQELCESRGGRPELSVLTSFLVSVDVKNY